MMKNNVQIRLNNLGVTHTMWTMDLLKEQCIGKSCPINSNIRNHTSQNGRIKKSQYCENEKKEN